MGRCQATSSAVTECGCPNCVTAQRCAEWVTLSQFERFKRLEDEDKRWQQVRRVMEGDYEP